MAGVGRMAVIIVRPGLAITRSAPFTLLGGLVLLLAIGSDSSTGPRLLVGVVGLLILAVPVVGLLRATVLARPGLVRSAIGRSWVRVVAPSEITIASHGAAPMARHRR